tara:strand:+ start:1079 stop:1450 length:372 start_codon:yes stop_codon:yes gene_type:complete
MLKELMSLGSTSKKIKIGKFSFEVSTLTERQSSELLSSLIGMDEQSRILSSKAHSVAVSIKTVNGQNFDDIINSMEDIPDDIETMPAKKIFFVNCLQSNVVNKLFEAYTDLNNILGDEDSKKK